MRPRKQDDFSRAIEKYGIDPEHHLARKKAIIYRMDRQLSPLAARVMLNEIESRRPARG